MVLINDVKDTWNTCEGIYYLAPTKLNEKQFWLQNGGNNAIWYDEIYKNWKLGIKSKIGTSTPAKLMTVTSDTGTKLPHETLWKYRTNNFWTRWIQSDDILVTLVEGGIVLGFF